MLEVGALAKLWTLQKSDAYRCLPDCCLTEQMRDLQTETQSWGEDLDPLVEVVEAVSSGIVEVDCWLQC